MPDRFPETSDFAIAFAAEYKGFMKAAGVTGAQIAERLDRSEGYVSERTNGKRALDTDDVDALAALAEWRGIDLMIELARRAEKRLQTAAPINLDAHRDARQSQRKVAKPKSRDRGGDDGEG